MMTDFSSILTFIGALVALSQLSTFASFIWFHYLRPTSWRKYLQGPSPYALITGATDGIGKGVAKDMYRKGFSLILHGRSQDKMDKVVQEIKALVPNGGDIQTFLADAKREGHDFQGTAKRFEGLNITVILNNVGGISPRPTTIDGEWSEEEHLEIIRCNLLFPTLLTRAFLPALRKRARQRPVTVAFTGSFAGSSSTPRVVMYSGSKAFISRISQCLHADERFDDPNSNLSFMYLEVGAVNSGSMTQPISWICPAADEYAKTVVHSFGSGRQVVVPYIGHALPIHLMTCLPVYLQAKTLKEEMKKVLELEAKKE